MKRVLRNTGGMAVLQKYWIAIVLLLLTGASFVSGYVAVFTALVFTFLVPGLVAYRFFNLKSHEIWAFVPLFSVLVSVQLVYYLSLALGYSQDTILFSFLALTAVYALMVYKKGEPIKPPQFLKLRQIKKTSVLVFATIFLISLAVLARTVWYGNQYGVVLTGSNWQDTPLHYEIIESLNNGNFPPQMPNYAGHPETYHYFVDFHTAIVEKGYGYLPTLLPVLNAVFILVFALAIYALARPYGRRAAVIAAVIAIFGWGLSYFGLFSALFNGQFSPFTDYMSQYQGLFGLPPMYDVLLQQRPLLVGLPVFAFVLLLLRNMEDKNRVILAGILTGLVYQFHNLSFFCCYIGYFIVLILNLKHFKLSYLFFLVPTVLALPFIFSGGLPGISFAFNTGFLDNFVKGNPVVFYVLNLGVPFLIALVSFVKKGSYLLKGTLIALLLIPLIFVLTPNVWDMFKFFLFAWIPIAVLSGSLLAKTKKSLALILIVLSVLASVSVVIFNVGTDYSGASWNEYNLGLWARSNTPERTVFLTYYSIHSPPAMIGGRLVVLSDINWPYGHGVPLGDILKRQSDVDRAYNGSEADLKQVVEIYNVSYVYVGNDELCNYPQCVAKFNHVSWLTSVYTIGNLYIYQVDLPTNG